MARRGNQLPPLTALDPGQANPLARGVAIDADDAARDKSAAAVVGARVVGQDDIAGEEGGNGDRGRERGLDVGVGGEAFALTRKDIKDYLAILKIKARPRIVPKTTRIKVYYAA